MRLTVRWLLAALLWLAAPASAAVVNGPKALRTLQRYDLPGGGNLPAHLLDAVHSKLGLPPDIQIPVALRLFGSSVYLADEKTNTVDWKHVGDVDMVLYLDPEEYRIALKREHPFKTMDWIEDEQRAGLKGLDEAIAKRLKEIAGQLGGVKQHHIIIPESGFEALDILPSGPAYGYHAYEPHFGGELGIAKLRGLAEKVIPPNLHAAISLRDGSVQSDIVQRLFWDGKVDSKLLKRFIQRALLLGDEERRARFRELLDAAALRRLDFWGRLDFRGRQRLKSLLARAHADWQEAEFDAAGRLHRTAEQAATEGANLVVVER